MKETIAFSVTHRYQASAERVFDAWLDPEVAQQFMFATETGEIVRAEIEPRVGGKFVMTDRRNGEDVEHTGEYLVIDRPRKLVFTFGVPAFSSEFNTITLDIEPLESGCQLTLTHVMSKEFEEYKDRSIQGWTKMLASLDRVLGA